MNMTTKLIEATITAFPMWQIILVMAGFVVIWTFYLYYKAGVSIDAALSLQFLCLLIPIILFLAQSDAKTLPIMGHMGTGIVFGQVLAFCIYAIGVGVKKFHHAA